MIPYKIDLFAIFIFLGIVQGIFLCFFFFSKENRQSKINIFQGILIASLTLSILEIFLMYTGYIADILFLVDFSEPISFLIGPSLYLMILSVRAGNFSRFQYLHFLPAIIYFFLFLPYYFANDNVKYNSWVAAYRLSVPFRECGSDARIPGITDHHTLLTLISLFAYSILSLIAVVRIFRERNESFFRPANPVLKNLLWSTLHPVVATILVLVVKIFNPNDTGDHLFAAYVGVIIYLISFRVMRESGFFRQASLADQQKYKSSQITDEQQHVLIQKLSRLMENEKPFLKPDFSLPELAKNLNVSVHALSQAINAGLNKSFFEMAAHYRVEEAKKLLIEKSHIKFEEISERVGYNSKSSFNNAFKKLTGKTPSEFRVSN